jgi:maltooligosyltrehalose synthase
MCKLRIPSATYRLQFSGQFRFEHARALAGYLDQLGVTDLCASPLLQARRGSGHGYDVTNPTHLNTEIGSEQELEADSALVLLKNAPSESVNVLTGEKVRSRAADQGNLLPLGDVFARFPVAVLRSL